MRILTLALLINFLSTVPVSASDGFILNFLNACKAGVGRLLGNPNVPISLPQNPLESISGKLTLNSNNYEQQSFQLNNQLAKVTPHLTGSIKLGELNYLIQTRVMLEHVLQNALQHGIKRSYGEDFEQAPVEISYRVLKDKSSIYLCVTNPKVKPFPPTLLRTVFPGEFPEVPYEERAEYKGAGVGLFDIYSNLAGLPSGSAIKWDATEKEVSFILRVPIQ